MWPKTVLMLSREYGGIAGAGGVKDVVKGLSVSLAQKGIKPFVVLPRYGFLNPFELGFERMNLTFVVDMNYAHEERVEKVSFWSKEQDKVQIYLIESDRFSEKNGIYTYTEKDEEIDPSRKKGEGHFDYFAMNCLHQKAALGLFLALGICPDVIHCHDGHTGIVPAIIREVDGFRHFFQKSIPVLTIHNAGIGHHQEVADLPFVKSITALPWRVIYHCLLNGSFDPLISGASYGLVNTVSEHYAKELLETELDAMTGWLGHALKDRGIELYGITNGIDVWEYNPKRGNEIGLTCAFDSINGDFKDKFNCKKGLLRMLSAGEAAAEFINGPFKEIEVFGSLEYRPDFPLFTVVGRISEQKGFDLLAQVFEGRFSLDNAFNLVILGSGKKEIEDHLKWVVSQPNNKGRMCFLAGYDRKLANRIFSAGDFFIIPSRFEPCGLTDFIAQLMGNIPIVRRTGGLYKVKDGVNGIVFHSEDPQELASAISRAMAVYYEDPKFLHAMQRQAIEIILKNYTWDKVVERYLDLYLKGKKQIQDGS